MRNGAGLGHAELAARAHFPYDSIRAAEDGPSLPDLPVLSAFVRGCGGTTEEWEERWRSLTKSPSLPVSAARQSGQSDAANAGARISSGTPAGDGPDPSIIIAALSRVAEDMATPGADETPAPPAAQPPVSFPPSSALPEVQPGNETKTAGWDPIRVSSAWPVLNYTPPAAEPLRGSASAGGAGVPWDTAPWAEDPQAAGSPAAGSRGGPRTGILLAVAVVVLCALIAALAIFA